MFVATSVTLTNELLSVATGWLEMLPWRVDIRRINRLERSMEIKANVFDLSGTLLTTIPLRFNEKWGRIYGISKEVSAGDPEGTALYFTVGAQHYPQYHLTHPVHLREGVTFTVFVVAEEPRLL